MLTSGKPREQLPCKSKKKKKQRRKKGTWLITTCDYSLASPKCGLPKASHVMIKTVIINATIKYSDKNDDDRDDLGERTMKNGT